MKASYDTMASHPIPLLKKTWWAVLASAIVTALCLYIRLPNKALHDWGEENQMASFVLQTIIYVLCTVTNILTGTVLWNWINKKSLWWNLKHYFAIWLISNLVAAAVILGISWAGIALVGDTAKTVAFAVAAVLTIIVMLPFGYLQPRVMLLEEGEKLRPWRSYAKGFRYSGGIFMLVFLGTIITLLIICVLFIPAFILCGAQTMAQLGAMDGDPLGTPAYFTPLFIVVSGILLFAFNYVEYWLSLAFAYLYGSYRTQEKERKQMEENKQITSYQQ